MKLKIKFFMVLLLTVIIIVYVAYRADREIEAYAETTLKNYINTAINDTILEYVNNNEQIFSEAVKRNYNEKSELVYISLNAAAVNKIQTGLKKDILITLKTIKEEQFNVPVGNLTGIKLLSGKGAKIKMKIAPLGTITSDATSTFESVGINHTLHKIGIKLTVYFEAACPFKSTRFEVNYFVLICESIIIGQIPQVFFN